MSPPFGGPPGLPPGGPGLALGGLNAMQPPPPPLMPPGGGGGLLALLVGMPDSTDPVMPHDPMMFGMQLGDPEPDPFASVPYQGRMTGGQSAQLIDQLEGMGLGAQPPRPDLMSLLGGGPPPGMAGPPPGIGGMAGPPPGAMGGIPGIR